MEEELKETDELITKMNEKLTELNSKLAILNNNNKENKIISPEQNAKDKLVLAYSIHALFFVYLKVIGMSPQKHQVHNELKNIQKKMMELKNLDNNNVNNNEIKKRPSVNKEAAARFIMASISDNQKENLENESKINIKSKYVGKKRKRELSSQSSKQSPSKKTKIV
eukprot:TRINITY_DN3165_c0_g1_i1.p1 TRINITY_DN3165_c0_g1~~TRINITY_DN3165_c0_g1_i1.p1  ORF type:complete len:167 (+),score=23.08 TRINITY_DN3165_c0_g1_i1:29-529(+)